MDGIDSCFSSLPTSSTSSLFARRGEIHLPFSYIQSFIYISSISQATESYHFPLRSGLRLNICLYNPLRGHIHHRRWNWSSQVRNGYDLIQFLAYGYWYWVDVEVIVFCWGAMLVVNCGDALSGGIAILVSTLSMAIVHMKSYPLLNLGSAGNVVTSGPRWRYWTQLRRLSY